MPALNRAVLTIEADADGDGTAETGVFEMGGNLTVRPQIRTGFLIEDRGSTINSVIASWVDDYGAADGETSKRRGFYVDLGGGQFTWDIEFRGWEGSVDDEGNSLQWGDDPAPSRTQTSATGEPPMTQISVLMRYINNAEIDSRGPATLEVAEFSTNGLYDPLDVILEGPQTTARASEPDGFDGRMTCIHAADLNDAYDAQYNTGK